MMERCNVVEGQIMAEGRLRSRHLDKVVYRAL
jgi:hypothetical protein